MQRKSRIRRSAWLAASLAAAACLPSLSARAAPLQAGAAISYEERSAVLDLMARYGQYVDAGNGEAYARLFTEDGELISPGASPDAPPKIHKGHDQLAAFVQEDKRDPTHISIHSLGQSILVKVAPDLIRVRTPMIAGELDGTRLYAATFKGYGVYEDDVVKTADGWRIRKRTARIYGVHPMSPEFLPPGVKP